MGSVVVSVDAELAWGFHDLGRPLSRQHATRVRHARTAWRELLDLMDEFGIPATWAVVGHLFLDGCDGEHLDHPKTTGWFDRDPGGTEKSRPDWFAPSLIKAIMGAEVDHEIASHSFSHVEFGAESTTRKIAGAEVRRCVDLAAELGLELESFCFPRNNVGHRQELIEGGFICYRGLPSRRGNDRPWLKKGSKFANYTLGTASPPTTRPIEDDTGLVNVPASLHLFSFEGAARRLAAPVTSNPIISQVRNGIEAAVTKDEVFHLWLHPNDLVRSADRERVRAAFSHIDDRRQRDDLRVETMSDVAARVRTHRKQR